MESNIANDNHKAKLDHFIDQTSHVKYILFITATVLLDFNSFHRQATTLNVSD
jgi:hypothetical protein